MPDPKPNPNSISDPFRKQNPKNKNNLSRTKVKMHAVLI